MYANALQNLYLISINVTNKLKEKFFHEYVPEVLDVSLKLILFRRMGWLIPIGVAKFERDSSGKIKCIVDTSSTTGKDRAHEQCEPYHQSTQ